jgi:hypothetical protein
MRAVLSPVNDPFLKSGHTSVQSAPTSEDSSLQDPQVPNRDFFGAMICPIEFQFSYTTRRVTTDRLQCVNESHSVPTLLGLTVGVSLPRAVLVKRPGGVFNLPVFALSNLPVNQFSELCVRPLSSHGLEWVD